MIRFGQDLCGNLEAATRREWLETNAIGGFASSTLPGINTRRYHGLLVAATKPPVGRLVLLSKLEETVIIDGDAFDLCSNQYQDVVHPTGYRYLKQFRLDPFPILTFEVHGVRIEKTVFMVQGENTTVVQYEIKSAGKARNVSLELRPLLAFRDYHSLTHENDALDRRVNVQPGVATFSPYPGLPALHLAHDSATVENTGDWYRRFKYDLELERGLDYQEDLFNPCVFRFDLGTLKRATVIASTERRDVASAALYRRNEVSRRRQTSLASPIADDFVSALHAASEQYIVSRGDHKSVIAGYPWFSDWGRDTMVALPGLTLPGRRFEVARSILQTFARHVDRGMLPNCFPDAGETPQYNTVDATLWFFEAIRSYVTYTGDLEFVRGLFGVLNDIINWPVRGTRFGIKVDANCLLYSGEAGVQLTWMDAKVGDWVVTPRRGNAVEIQALWYNALCIMEDFAQRLGDESGRKRYGGLATLVRWSFNRQFWNEKGGYLYDVVNACVPDASIRPNQIFAVSLPYTMLRPERAMLVVDVVQRHLLTPYGLRTLAPGDPEYRGRYTGGPYIRDGAYHQGTVWPWLMGPFITAYLRVNGGSPAARQQAEAWLSSLKDHLSDAGVGHISEIFNGDPPHRPVGCIAQAWSVAEVLRATVEDIHGVRPAAKSLVKAAIELKPLASGEPPVARAGNE
jgi:predicted glycogen debranching enzyme